MCVKNDFMIRPLTISLFRLRIICASKLFNLSLCLRSGISTTCGRKESFITGSSAVYLENMYDAWLRDPTSVHASWDSYFKNNQYTSPLKSTLLPTTNGKKAEISDSSNIESHLAVQGVIRNYQLRGHLVAQLDPLGILYTDNKQTLSDRIGGPPEQVLRSFHLEKDDLDKTFILPKFTAIGGSEKALPLREIIKRLEYVYCRHIAIEYAYINSLEEVNWIRTRLETPGAGIISPEQRRLCLDRLSRSAGFEHFLAKKWSSEKRFGLEGCDVLIPAMKQIIDKSSEAGVETVVIGMPHRGRLNVLANVCRKSLVQLFTQFHGLKAEDEGSGDVKYHLGTSIERLNRHTNKNIKMVVMANPSHLEAVCPVVQGKVRAEQFLKGDTEGNRVMSILLHGDAAFCGQGIVYETLHLSHLPNYKTFGTIHIVANNQIGFTTDPRFSRSSEYCTDVGKVLNVPIFHVNADDPDSVIHVCNIAADYRATFHKDVIIDIVGYRRNGHNEVDEPMFTQPLMYTKIKSMKPVLTLYGEKLVADGVATKKDYEELVDTYNTICEEAYEAAKKQTFMRLKDWIDSPWSGFFEGKDPLKVSPTGVKEEILTHIGKIYSSHPPPELDFKMHKGLERILKQRADYIKNRIADWSIGEAFGWGSLLREGIHVRLSGQDVERGTFSHRHHVLHHQTKDKVIYRPLSNLYPDQAQFSNNNSSLSEYGVLGFEVGYSMCNPHFLVIWESQFGDFANTAQCIIDQFISSGQSKWVRQSAITLLLPHGMEGMGPEHSSARMERFLQMCADDPDEFPPTKNMVIKQLFDCNWIVAYLTTPANLFHIFRRQIALPFRKPCIIMSPKSLLRHPDARSSFDDMLEGTEFQRMIPEKEEASQDPGSVKKLLFCTGKVYYDVRRERNKANLQKEIAMARIEQLYPFPYDLIKAETDKYCNANVAWLQEEHKNQGAWGFFQPRFYTCMNRSRKLSYIGRAVSPSSATGSKAQHLAELATLFSDALRL